MISVAEALPAAETDIAKLPKDLTSKQYWIAWKPVWKDKVSKYIKVPVCARGKKPVLSKFTDVSSGQYIGFYMLKSSGLVCIDYDNVLDKELLAFIKDNPTYTEYSPSGKESGKLHAWYRLPSIISTDTDNNKHKDNLDKSKLIRTTANKHSELFLHNFFLTMTGRPTSYSVDKVLELDKNAFIELIKLFKPNKVARMDGDKAKDSQDHTARIQRQMSQNGVQFPDINVWIATVPCDANNPLVQLRCKQQGWDNYTYWLTGLQALHYFSKGSAEGLAYADKWSKQDQEKYGGFEDVKSRWESFSFDKTDQVTERTYMLLFKFFVLDWPTQAKGKAPVPGDYYNFLAILKHYGISINIDKITLVPFIDAPKTMLFPTFYEDSEEQFSYRNSIESIAAKLFVFVQQFYKPTYDMVKKHIMAYCLTLKQSAFYNPFIHWLDSKAWDGRDYFSELFSCYKINTSVTNPKLAKVFFKKWMFSVLRTYVMDELSVGCQRATYEGVLIISGTERTNKTTSFRMLLPKEFERYYVAAPLVLDGSSQEKDSVLRTTGRLIAICDEIEDSINSNKESRLKEFITRPYDTIRPPYGTKNIDYPRQCALGGTTNELELNIPDDGARRYWIVRIRSIDVSKMQNMDLQQLWAQIKYELIEEGKDAVHAPWLLTDKELKNQRKSLVSHYKTSNEFDMIADYYDWDGYEEYIRDLTNRVNNVGTYSKSCSDIALDLGIARKKSLSYAVKKALKLLGQPFIKTMRGKIIKNGIYMLSKSPRAQVRYIMPLKRITVFNEVVKEEELR